MKDGIVHYAGLFNGSTEPRPRRGRRTSQLLSLRRGGRPLAYSAVVCTLLCSVLSAPAHADPGGTTVPDSGSRPVASGALTAPGAATNAQLPQAGPTVLGPLGVQITTEQRAVQALGEQLKSIVIDLAAAEEAVVEARTRLEEAEERLAELRGEADSAATEAYKRATALGPYASYADTLRRLSVIAPGVDDEPGGPSTAYEAGRAEQAARAARDAHDTAVANEQALRARHDTAKQSFDQRTAALNDLTTRNAAQLPLIDAQRNAYERSLGGTNLTTTSIDGLTADPRAVKAVEFARSHVDKSWYLWAAEGPNRFDCSGLMWAAYREAGYTLPRVAKDQYLGTRAIRHSTSNDISNRGNLLLPGDLVFFADDLSNPQTIGHVGIYSGGGNMIHAPRSGTQVQEGPVWWSSLYGATRIFGPVPGSPPVPVPPMAARPTTPATTLAPTTPPPTTPPPTTPPPTTLPPTTPPPSTPPPTTPPPTTPPPITPPPTTPPPTTPPPTTPPPSTPPPSETPSATPSARPSGQAAASPATSNSGEASAPPG